MFDTKKSSEKKTKVRSRKVVNEEQIVSVTVGLPATVHDELSALLEGRGTTLENFLLVMARAYLRTPSMHELWTPLNYKKYSGSSLEDAIRLDPSYVRWLLGNVRGFRMSEQAHKLLQTIDPEGV